MATFVAVPILGGLMMIQSGILSQVPLLRGIPDLLLLALAAWALQKRVHTAWQWAIIAGLAYQLVSALPSGIPFIGYALTVGISLALRRRVWQAPILAMFIGTFLSTLIFQGLSFLSLRVIGAPISPIESINLVLLPSLLLNLLLAAPAYAMISDLANWLYPEILEV